MDKKKKLPDRYIYPAIFTYEPDREIAVVFPDIELATSGTDDSDALFSAREALAGRLAIMEEDGDDIPEPTSLQDIQTDDNCRVVLVDAYMPSVRLENVNKAVNRTVTLPAWLNALALEHNINFSQTLQEALKDKLRLA